MVVTPTLKAAQVAAAEIGAEGHSAAWLIHQHGCRWDDDGHWTRQPDPRPSRGRAAAARRPAARRRGRHARPGHRPRAAHHRRRDRRPGRVRRRPAPAPRRRPRRRPRPRHPAGRTPTAVVTLETVHRFTDPDYADLTPADAHWRRPGEVFDALHRRGQIVIHPTEVERTAALAEAGAHGDLVIADTREQVADLNAAIRDHRTPTVDGDPGERGHHRRRRADRARRPGRDPPQRPRPRGREPADLDRDRHRRRRQPHSCTAAARDRVIPADVRGPVRRARLRHHRPRRPGRDRRLRPPPHRRAHRRRRGVRRA